MQLDRKGVFRHPNELQPLSLKNADNKVVAGVGNWCIKPVVADAAMRSQADLFIRGSWCKLLPTLILFHDSERWSFILDISVSI